MLELFGIVLNAPGVFLVFKFSSIAGSPRRNKLFYIGIAAQALSMAGIAFGNSYLAVVVIMLTCYNIGNQIAGEPLYKALAPGVFPGGVKDFFPGLHLRRFQAALRVTPSLVAAGKLQSTMLGFAGLALLSGAAGSLMIRLQRKYGLEEVKAHLSLISGLLMMCPVVFQPSLLEL